MTRNMLTLSLPAIALAASGLRAQTRAANPLDPAAVRDRNTNVNVNVDRGRCNDGWDNAYQPVATAAAVTATVAVTSAVIGSMGSEGGGGYVVVNPPY